MIDIDYYIKYINVGSNNNKKVVELGERYSEQLSEGISKFDILINSIKAEKIKLNGIEYDALVDYRRIKEPILDSLVRNIEMYQGIMRYGDYVEYKDKNSNEVNTYLIKSKIEFKDRYDEAYMQVCNNTLKLKVKINNKDEILEMPCITNSNVLSIEEGRFFNTDDKKITCEVGYSMKDKLKYIKDTENPTRFILNGMAFKTYAIDNITKMMGNQGIYLVKLESCAKLPEDDLISGIAYNECKNADGNIKLESNSVYSILNTQNSEVDYINLKNARSYHVVDQNLNEITKKIIWTIEQSDKNPSVTSQILITKIENNDNTCRLYANEKVKGFFWLVASFQDNVIKRELRIKGIMDD